MTTRIAKLHGFKNTIIGRDFDNIFQDGHVYSAVKIMGEIIFKDLGEHAKMEAYTGQPISSILIDGRYCLTKEENHDLNEYKNDTDNI